MAGLARMANRDHRFVEMKPGDTVIVSASPIPGNEEYVARTIDNLFKLGANVYYHAIKRAHVSGHASQEELKLMLNLTKPRTFIPIHGEFRMLVQHGRLAAEVGVAPENIFIIENGQSIEYLPDGSVRRGPRVEAGYVFVDGLSVGEVGDVVLRDRRALANDGMFLIVVTVDKQTGSLVGKPEIVTRGFVTAPDDSLIPAPPTGSCAGHRHARRPHREIALLKQQIKDAVSQYLYEKTRRRPMVFPVVVEVRPGGRSPAIDCRRTSVPEHGVIVGPSYGACAAPRPRRRRVRAAVCHRAGHLRSLVGDRPAGRRGRYPHRAWRCWAAGIPNKLVVGPPAAQLRPGRLAAGRAAPGCRRTRGARAKDRQRLGRGRHRRPGALPGRGGPHPPRLGEGYQQKKVLAQGAAASAISERAPE